MCQFRLKCTYTRKIVSYSNNVQFVAEFINFICQLEVMIWQLETIAFQLWYSLLKLSLPVKFYLRLPHLVYFHKKVHSFAAKDIVHKQLQQRHEDQEHSPPCAHSCNGPGICVFASVLILAMVQDQVLVASKHYLIETENKFRDVGGRFFLVRFPSCIVYQSIPK